MEKQIKIAFYLLTLFTIFVTLHNIVSGLFKIEEPVFFSLALLSALALCISLVYAFFVWIKKILKR